MCIVRGHVRSQWDAAIAHHSDAVERLFSKVGIAFDKKRRSAEGQTLADIMFAQANLP